MQGPQLAQWLSVHPAVEQLISLHLGGNFIGDGGLQCLVESPYVARLQELNLSQNNLSEKSARALTGALHLRKLAKLNLSNNYLGDEGAHAFTEAFEAKSWLSRWLSAWFIPQKPALPLTMQETDNPYREGHTPKAPEGPTVLGALVWLDLGWNRLTDKGCRRLAESPLLQRLTYLNLQNNAITFEGAEALSRSEYASKELVLNISGNPFSSMEKRTLRNLFGDRVRI